MISYLDCTLLKALTQTLQINFLNSRISHRNCKVMNIYYCFKYWGMWLHVVVQLFTRVQLFETPWTTACQASLSFTRSWRLLKLMSIESVMPSNHFILCRLLFLLPSIFPSIRAFLMSVRSFLQVAKVLELQHQSFQWTNIQYWFPLGFSSLISLQSKGLSRVFSNTQFKRINSLALSHLYGPTLTSIYDYWKNHSYDYTDFFVKVMSLLFNMLSRLVIAFLLRSKPLNFISAVSIRSDFWIPRK